MFKYIVKRLLLGIFTLFILATIVFFGMKAMPGSPFSRDNKAIPAATMEALNKKYGLDKPVSEQYVVYMKNVIHGDFGVSISKKGQSVTEIIKTRLPVTAKLGVIAFVVSMLVGITLGVISALTNKQWVNSLITILATIGVSVPGFLLAMLMMILLAVNLKLLPVVGLETPASYIMPVLALSFSPISTITRLTRSSLRDVMGSDFITLARSKGTKESMVVIKHGLKNALLPVITYAGPMFAGMITGSLVIETLFSIPGIGREFTTSISNRDYTLCMGLTILLGALVIIMTLVSDVVSAMVDPRIKVNK
ncbi:MAG: ABC transporter permease [Solobacterium sp.]|nr:ABC transporter permease [Solobacterium sp.]MDY2953408.1 ABC transporter permease [Erysipelotrichaceae bacterium]MCI6878062.1 ABC transporter permease [Solobacterium sp.]MCI7157546.1 ABC transporter permease [Solobacterium sp.]MCI7445681.1 ABC transporter permease [Solobacterium sp.]